MFKKILIFSMIMVLILGSMAMAQRRLDYSGYIRSAKIYLKQTPKDYKSAAERCEDAIKYYPDEPPLEAHFLLGSIYADKRLYEDMAAEFNKIKEYCANPTDKDTKKACEKADFFEQMDKIIAGEWIDQYNSGVNALKRAREADTCSSITDDALKMDCMAEIKETYDGAQEYFEISTIILPDSAQGWINLGLIYYSTGDAEKAMLNYRKALAINDKDLSLLSNMSSIFFNEHEYDSAVTYFTKMLELDLDDQTRADVLYNAAFGMNAVGNLDSAIILLSKVIEITPESPDALYNLGAFKIKKAAEYNEEINILRGDTDETAKKNRPQIDSIMKIIKGMYTDAIPDFEKVISLQPDNIDALEWLGNAYFFLERWDEALATYEMIIEILPDNEDAWCQILLLKLKKNDKAGINEAKKHCDRYN